MSRTWVRDAIHTLRVSGCFDVGTCLEMMFRFYDWLHRKTNAESVNASEVNTNKLQIQSEGDIGKTFLYKR
jgi:hypothetical protein